MPTPLTCSQSNITVEAGSTLVATNEIKTWY